MNTQNIPVYCINLLRASDRRKQIIDQWTHKLDINIEFIEAVDRRKLTDLSTNKISTGEIACIMSHNLAYDKLLNSPHDMALILEDDSIPLFKDTSRGKRLYKNQLFDTIYKSFSEFPESYALILHKTSRRYGIPVGPFIVEKKIYSSLLQGSTSGTYGYVIKKSGVDFIRQDMLQFNCPMDYLWDNYSNALKLIVSNEYYIRHPDVKSASTYINRTKNFNKNNYCK
jgi:glycosyl transferase family 25